MGKLMIVNGSPRAVKSNSKNYIEIVKKYINKDIEEYNAISKKIDLFISKLNGCSDLLLVFPLYADGLPVTLMRFLKELENAKLTQKIKIHVLINCGFVEPEQNDVAVEMIKLFCKKHHFEFSCVLRIASGEAILKTPFAFIAKWNIKKLVKAIEKDNQINIKCTMPISKKTFIKASTNYWIKYGQKNNITKEQMETMKIEDM